MSRYHFTWVKTHFGGFYWVAGWSSCRLKGRDSATRFSTSFFSWISFPQAPEYTIRVVSNFFENSHNYSQLKVHYRCRWHRWQMKKIFKLNILIILFGHPSGSRVNIYINFCLQVHFKMSAAWYCSHYLLRCHWHQWQICRRCRWYRWQLATFVIVTSGKFVAGIVDTCDKCATDINNPSETGGKICHRCCWFWWCTLSCEYLREFSKKIRNSSNGILWGWGETDSSKNQKQKILWHCPFNTHQSGCLRACHTRRQCRFLQRERTGAWRGSANNDSKKTPGIAGQCRINPRRAVPDWPWCRTVANLKQNSGHWSGV